MHATSHEISLTTDGSGDVTAYTPASVSGRIFQIQYVKTDFDAGSTITLTGAKTGVPIFTITGMNASATHQVRNIRPVGANRVTNGGFTDWTGANDDTEVPTGTWTRAPANDTVNLRLREVGIGEFDGGAGTGAVNIWTDDGSDIALLTTVVLTAGKAYRLTFDVWVNGGSGDLRIQNDAANVTYASISTSGAKTVYFTAVDTRLRFREASGVGTTDVTIDNVEARQVFRQYTKTVLAGERIKCVVSGGGNTKSGALAIIVG